MTPDRDRSHERQRKKPDHCIVHPKKLKGIDSHDIYIYAIDARGRARAIKPAFRYFFFRIAMVDRDRRKMYLGKAVFVMLGRNVSVLFFTSYLDSIQGRAQRNRKQRGVGFQPKAKHPLADRQSYNRYPPQINTSNTALHTIYEPHSIT